MNHVTLWVKDRNIKDIKLKKKKINFCVQDKKDIQYTQLFPSSIFFLYTFDFILLKFE